MQNNLDVLFPPPFEVRQRAWDCAFVLGAQDGNVIGCPGRWHWLLAVVHHGPDAITWRQCGALRRLYSLVAERERAAGALGW